MDSSRPHALILPYPAQGHVIALMELAHSLFSHGVAITFVNTEFNHDRLIAAFNPDNRFRMVSVPDGLGPDDDRNDIFALGKACRERFPAFLEKLVLASNEPGEHRFTWMITDAATSWALSVAKELGLRRASFFTLPVAAKVLIRSVTKLIEEGIIDEHGLPTRDEIVCLGPGMPPMRSTEFLWNHVGKTRYPKQMMFGRIVANKTPDLSEFLLCNSSADLEPSSFAATPDILPVGPILSGRKLGRPAGCFWPEEAPECVNWLDAQPAHSVIYVAFGSIATLGPAQFQELALGLELTGRAFLWVIRPGLSDGGFPTGFIDRVGARARIVGWVPQCRVLAHPSVACFLSHCGWNSTMEGLTNGIPFLCWPYFGDQFLNQSYICDVWGTGLRMDGHDGSGVISRDRIGSRVQELVGDCEIKGRALEWKGKVRRSVGEGGSSSENLNRFVEIVKE